MSKINAEVLLPTQELRDDIPFYTEVLGMRMDMIYPADDPTVAVFSGHGLRVRIEKNAEVSPGKIRILCENPNDFAAGKRSLKAPNGTKIERDGFFVVAGDLKHRRLNRFTRAQSNGGFVFAV